MALDMNKAVFLDKDGTLVENVPNNVDTEKIKLFVEVPEALRILKANGFKIVIITNQPGVAHGYFEEQAVLNVKDALRDMFEKQAVDLDGFYYCPHHVIGKVAAYSIECSCRKPLPGMILQAAKELSIDLSNSWMVGDILHDVEAGNRAGCKTILLNNGNETEWIINDKRSPNYIVKDVKEAVKKIVFQDKMRKMALERRFE